MARLEGEPVIFGRVIRFVRLLTRALAPNRDPEGVNVTVRALIAFRG